MKQKIIKIQIGKAVALRNNLQQFKNVRSTFGYCCLQLSKELTKVLEPFDTEYQFKKIEFAIKGEKGEVLTDEKGRFKSDVDGMKQLQLWYSREAQREIEMNVYQTEEFEVIKDDLEALDFFNGILFEIEIEKFLN